VVVDGIPITAHAVDVWLTSASQIQLYRDCARKWAFRYLAGLKTPQHPAAALGEEVDTYQLQPYLRDDRPFDFTKPSGEIAASGLVYLPKPKSNKLEVQKHFVIPSPTFIEVDGKKEPIGIKFQGYIDLWMPEGNGTTTNLTIIDFKTTSDLKWAKSEEDLKTDVQAQLYAFAGMYLTRKPVADLAWVYFQTRGARRAKQTQLRVTADHAAEQFQRIDNIAIEMKGVRDQNPNPLDLPANPEACEAYGGCPYRDRCNLSPAQVIAAIAAKEERVEIMSNAGSMLAAMRAKKAGAQTGQQAAALAPAPAAQSAPSPPSPSVAEHVAANPQAAWMTAPQDPRYAVIGKRPNGAPIFAYEVAGQAAPINPPESASVFPAAAPEKEVPVATLPPLGVKRRGRPPKAEQTAPAPEDVTLQNEPPAEVTHAKAMSDLDQFVRLADRTTRYALAAAFEKLAAELRGSP
jgi:RecB family exonuclease